MIPLPSLAVAGGAVGAGWANGETVALVGNARGAAGVVASVVGATEVAPAPGAGVAARGAAGGRATVGRVGAGRPLAVGVGVGACVTVGDGAGVGAARAVTTTGLSESTGPGARGAGVGVAGGSLKSLTDWAKAAPECSAQPSASAETVALFILPRHAFILSTIGLPRAVSVPGRE